MMMIGTWKLRAFALLAAGLLVVGGPAQAGDDPHDPYEGFNRAMFAVNEGLDMVAVKPLAQVYDGVMPLPAKASIGNFFDNIADVRNALNNTLQGKLAEAGSDLGRLLINSTVGIFGLFDVASELGLERHEEDFGQTPAVTFTGRWSGRKPCAIPSAWSATSTAIRPGGRSTSRSPRATAWSACA